MNNVMKRFLSMGIVAAMFAGTLAGCANEKTSETKSENVSGSKEVAADVTTETEMEADTVTFPLSESVTMSMFGIANNNISLDQTKAFEYLEEKTNVKWEVQSVGGTELAEKRGLLLSTGQYPDVFFKAALDQSILDQYGSQGIFIALNDLIEKYAPNLSALLEERPSIRDLITSVDGNIYSLPMVNPMAPAMPPVFINKVWLENLGLKEPTDLDELYDVLKAFKEQDANGNGDPDDEIPISAYTGEIIYSLLPYFEIYYNSSTKTGVVDGEYQYIPASEKYKEFLAYVTKLYEDGILDEQAFSQTEAQYQAVGMSGDVYGVIICAGPVQIVGRERDENYPILTPFDPSVYPISTGADVGTFAITDICETPEIAIAWVDQFYTEEGGRLAWMGIENESYKINEDGTWEWILGSEYADITAVRQNYTLQGSALMPELKPDLWIEGSTDPENIFITAQRNRMVEIGGDPFPTLKISDADNKILATITADINPYLLQYFAKVAIGELDLESSWDEYLTTLNNMRLPELMEIYTNAYNQATGK